MGQPVAQPMGQPPQYAAPPPGMPGGFTPGPNAWPASGIFGFTEDFPGCLFVSCCTPCAVYQIGQAMGKGMLRAMQH